MRRHAIAALVGSAATLALIAGCTDNNGRSANDTASNDQNGQSQEVSREVINSQGNMGGIAAKRGETDVKSQQEVVTRKRETVNEQVPTVVTGQKKLDLNRMNTDDFVALGLERDAADRIVNYRDQHGPFQSADQLSQIQGINPQWLGKYRDQFAFVSPDQNKDQNRAGQAGDR